MFASLILGLLASQGIAYNATYDCGPNYATFKVMSCSAGICDVYYTNPGRATRHERLYQSQLTTAISRGCHTGKTAQDYRDEAAQDEARANALLHQNPAAQRPVPLRPVVRRPAAPAGGGLVLGKYECYTYSGGEL